MGDLSKHFNKSEFQCKGTNCGLNGGNCNFNKVSPELIEVLEDLRETYGLPITINSGCRCPKHNAAVGGSKLSTHMQGIAADIVVKGMSPAKVYQYLNGKYPNQYGIAAADTFTHIDVRKNKARWKY
jgi:uncharacterized protein YcbK (DUF882 family)